MAVTKNIWKDHDSILIKDSGLRVSTRIAMNFWIMTVKKNISNKKGYMRPRSGHWADGIDESSVTLTCYYFTKPPLIWEQPNVLILDPHFVRANSFEFRGNVCAYLVYQKIFISKEVLDVNSLETNRIPDWDLNKSCHHTRCFDIYTSFKVLVIYFLHLSRSPTRKR